MADKITLRKIRMILTPLLLIGVLSLCLAGCKKENSHDAEHLDKLRKTIEDAKSRSQEKPQTEEPLKADVTDEKPEEADNKTAAGDFAGAFADGKVENNGGYFVRVGDKVYYRVYHVRALERTSISQFFLDEKDATFPSELYCYDLKTEETEKICDVAGQGKLYAVTEGFCLRTPDGFQTKLVRPDGSDGGIYGKGAIECVSKDGRSACFAVYQDDVRPKHALFRDGQQITLLSEEGSDYLDIEGFAGNDLIGMRYHEDDNEYAVFSCDENGNDTELGIIPTPEGFAYMTPEWEQLAYDPSRFYFMIGFYEGSGHFLQSWECMEAVANQAGSLKIFHDSANDTAVAYGEEYIDRVPRIFLSDAGAGLTPYATGDVFLSEGSYGDLQYCDGNGYQTLEKNYSPENDEWTRYDTFLQDAVVFGDKVFVISADVNRDEPADVGWRWAYDLHWLNYDVYMTDGRDKRVLSMLTSVGWGDAVTDEGRLTGTWDLYSYEVEGTYGISEEDGVYEQLVFNGDGSATYIHGAKDLSSSRKERKLHRVPADNEDIPVSFETEEDGEQPLHFDIWALSHGQLDVGVSYTYDGGIPGMYHGWYFKGEE